MKISGDDTDNNITGTDEGDTIRAGLGNDTVNGAGGDDTITGGGGADHLSGGTGNDFIQGDDGNDTIDGGVGTDNVHGDGGDDVILADNGGGGNVDGGIGFDTLDFGNLATAVTVDLAAGTATGADIGAMTILSIEQVNGGAGDDTMNGSAGNDVLDGGAGKDALFGWDGHDTLDGGTGNDRLNGGNGDDVLLGGAGNDILTGALGADTLNGGDGSNTFAYGARLGAEASSSVNYDTIDGFNATQDRISLWFHPTAMDTAITTGKLDEATFNSDLGRVVNANTLAAGDAVFFTADSGIHAGDTFLVVDANGQAGYQAGQDLVIEFSNATNLDTFSTSNFV